MKKLKKGMFKSDELYKPHYNQRGANQKIYDAVAELDVGDALVFSENEWYGATKPSASINNLTNPACRTDRSEYSYVFSDLGRKMVGKKFSIKLNEKNEHVVIRVEDREYMTLLQQALHSYDIFLSAFKKSRKSNL